MCSRAVSAARAHASPAGWGGLIADHNPRPAVSGSERPGSRRGDETSPERVQIVVTCRVAAPAMSEYSQCLPGAAEPYGGVRVERGAGRGRDRQRTLISFESK